MQVFSFPELQKVYALGVQIHSEEPTTFYSLFRKASNGRWVRIRQQAIKSESWAMQVWGEFIVLDPKLYSIRKVTIQPSFAK